MSAISPGSVVRCRERRWVLMPADSDDVYVLRPLTGTDEDLVTVNKSVADILKVDHPFESVTADKFPPPTDDDISDAASSHLLWQAARLTLREGAAPFRSLGRISVRPRVYQFVPLLMAMRINPVRLFIADDVGVGKTIESLLVARELFDRNEIRRLCVLCPPYLCDQWAKELSQKFNFEPVVIRSGTLGQLERQVPPGKSVYEHFPFQVASIDFIKNERNQHQFLHFCPELVIVDEVHGAAAAPGGNQQERHDLLKKVAKDHTRHLILLTATPHSGVEEAFRSLLAVLSPDFADWSFAELNEDQRKTLARHFVQRTRADIKEKWEEHAPFPKRESSDQTYTLSPDYKKLFKRTYDFCYEIVETGKSLEKRKRRVRYWGALALLRCVMSSPEAALTALAKRGGWISEDDGDLDLAHLLFEPDDGRIYDEAPTLPAIETFADVSRRKLRELAQLASQLPGPESDAKLRQAIDLVHNLLREGHNPILWCHYVATAEYLARYLKDTLSQNVQVVCLTGRSSDDERQAKIQEIETDRPRVLVATDCLSEGINLQEKFSAVVHYDLPWNPNRLEQREGRVDRYGQQAKVVKAVRLYGRGNPMDGVVIKVLLDKAREIHRTLGTYVPVPQDGESVTEAVLEALFFRKKWQYDAQLTLDIELADKVDTFHHKWDQDVKRERKNRTLFAQRAMKPEEVQRELDETDAILGDPDAVRDFVLNAAQRIGLQIEQSRPHVFRVLNEALNEVPDMVRRSIPITKENSWIISFTSPTPEGAEYVGRNHQFVATLARFLLEEALNGKDKAVASRCGAIRTRAVETLTSIFLLRPRYLIEQPQTSPLLAEEVLVFAKTASGWLEEGEALRLLSEAKPDANIPLAEKKELVKMVLNDWQNLQRDVDERVRVRANKLAESHKRIRNVMSMTSNEFLVKPQHSPDLLGILVLQPMVEQ